MKARDWQHVQRVLARLSEREDAEALERRIRLAQREDRANG